MKNGGKEQLRLALTSSGIHLEPPGDDCYYFRKGRSRSKVYGDGDPGTSSTPKRPKFDKEMKAERIRQIQDGLNDLTRVLALRLQQAEAGGNYRVCELITEEMMELKSRKRHAVRRGKMGS